MRTLEKLYKERIRITKECQDNWDYGIDQICKELIHDHFQNNVDKAISEINNWSRDYIAIFSEYFPDFIDSLPSQKLLNCLIYKANQFPDLNLSLELKWAKEIYDSKDHKLD